MNIEHLLSEDSQTWKKENKEEFLMIIQEERVMKMTCLELSVIDSDVLCSIRSQIRHMAADRLRLQ